MASDMEMDPGLATEVHQTPAAISSVPEPPELSTEELRKRLTEAEATIVRAQNALGSGHRVFWILDDYDGSMDSVKTLAKERDDAIQYRTHLERLMGDAAKLSDKAAIQYQNKAEKMIGEISRVSAETVITGLQERGMIVTPQISVVLSVATKLVEMYRQESFGYKPRTEVVMQMLIQAVDDL